MSTNTTNYQLIKPDRTDNVLVENINYNTEIIDQELKKNANSIINLPSTYVLKTDLATETTNGTSKLATQTEVNNGLEDTKIVTSKKLKARLDSLLSGITSTYVKLTQLATESLAGIIKISTTAQVSAGTDNTTAVTPYTLSEAFANLKTTNGYQKLSNGAIIQWGVIAYTSPGNSLGNITNVNVNFPVAFPTKMSTITFSGFNSANGDDGVECQHSCDVSSKSGITFRATRLVGSAVAGSQGNAYYIAIGY